MLKTRIKTAIVLIIIIGVLICFSHVPYVMQSFVALISCLGIYELYKVTGNLKPVVPFIVSEVIALAISFFEIPYYNIILAVCFPIAVIAFLLLMKFYGKYSFDKWYKVFPLALMIPLFYSTFTSIRNLDNGLYFIFLFAIVCAISDTGAYFVGKAMGKHKLAPNVSPKKTIEGSIGGMISALVVVLIAGFIVDMVTDLSVNYLFLSIYTLIASVIEQIGDLSMSVIKRVAGVKDYSNLLPGHGGILDRFDSYMFAAPFTLLFYTFVNTILK